MKRRYTVIASAVLLAAVGWAQRAIFATPPDEVQEVALTVIAAGSDSGRITGNHAVYATARTTSTSADAGGTTVNVGQVHAVDVGYTVQRGFLSFNTNGIPAAATVTSVTLTGTVVADNTDDDFLLLVTFVDWTTPLTSAREANYDSVLVAAGGYFETFIDSSGITGPNQEFSVVISNDAIVKAGTTRLALLSMNDLATTAPGDTRGEWLQLAGPTHATASYRPKLTVVDTVPTRYSGELGQTNSAAGIYAGEG